MMYQVWTKEEYADAWKVVECESMAEVKEEILAATRAGHEIKVSLPMEFSIEVEIKEEPTKAPFKKEQPPAPGEKKEKEVPKVETAKSGPEKDNGSGSEGHSSV